jgi:hypothetical protein
MLNANKTVKMAEKRAMVDAILRCAALPQWITQDLEETQFDARLATVNAIRLWLHRTRKSEAEILKHYRIGTLEELTKETADRLVKRHSPTGHVRRSGCARSTAPTSCVGYRRERGQPRPALSALASRHAVLATCENRLACG